MDYKEEKGQEKSHFEDIPESERPCVHPEHEPPKYLFIPQGKRYIHICPKCERKIIINPGVYMYSVRVAMADDWLENRKEYLLNQGIKFIQP